MTTDAHAIEADRLERLEQATDWLLRLQESTRTEDDLNLWLRWCDADPKNFAAFETVQRRWQELDALKFDPAMATAGVLVEPARHARRWKLPLAIAAAAGVAAVAVGLLVQRQQVTPDPAPETVAAAHSSRAATLPDGSRIILGAQSRVNMDFNGPKRQLDLSSGEAYFKVKHDSARPFVVHAGEV
ncbi:FecR family protein, partial [Steroidobacter sp.]|uniref:FecR family protein n=1 Tax=Steroidobacter sp. TaxID=1978227 RepID=UPI001A55A45F